MSEKQQKSALLVIDMQKAFVEPGAAHCIKGAKATVPYCAEEIEKARRAGIPVFWIKRQYRQDGSDVEFTRRQSWLDGGRTMAPGSKGINSEELAEGLVQQPEDYEIIKPRWSAFFQTKLDLVLRRLGVDTVILIGTTTPNCIRITCYDAIALDYRTVIIERCCSSQNEEIQRVNMEDMERIGAVIVRQHTEG
ncbi:MAG: cysteine hydrolase family protein [Anaerovoracaceae bacterium]